MHTPSPFPSALPVNADDMIVPMVEGTKAALEACKEAKCVKQVVLTCSAAAVTSGTGDHSVEVSEEDWMNMGDKYCPLYYKSKTFAEKAAWEFIKELPEDIKFELEVINPGYVMGLLLSDNDCNKQEEVVKRLLEKSTSTIPKVSFGTMDVCDVTDAHVEAMTSPDATDFMIVVEPELEPNVCQVSSMTFQLLGKCYFFDNLNNFIWIRLILFAMMFMSCAATVGPCYCSGTTMTCYNDVTIDQMSCLCIGQRIEKLSFNEDVHLLQCISVAKLLRTLSQMKQLDRIVLASPEQCDYMIGTFSCTGVDGCMSKCLIPNKNYSMNGFPKLTENDRQLENDQPFVTSHDAREQNLKNKSSDAMIKLRFGWDKYTMEVYGSTVAGACFAIAIIVVGLLVLYYRISPIERFFRANHGNKELLVDEMTERGVSLVTEDVSDASNTVRSGLSLTKLEVTAEIHDQPGEDEELDASIQSATPSAITNQPALLSRPLQRRLFGRNRELVEEKMLPETPAIDKRVRCGIDTSTRMSQRIAARQKGTSG